MYYTMSQSTKSVKMLKCGGCLCSYLLCLIFISTLATDNVKAQELRPPASDFNRHRLVQPTIHHGRTKREISTTKDTGGAHHSEVTMKIIIDGEEYTLDLRLNEDLVPDNHVIRYQKDGKTVHHTPKAEDLDICQYSGTVRGKPDSWAALSTCRGVRGVIYDGKQMRYIQPAEGDNVNSNHYVYDHTDLNTSFHCGYRGGVTNNTEFDPLLLKEHLKEKDRQKSRVSRYKRSTYEDTLVRGPYNANKLSRYVELVLIADHGEFVANGEDLNLAHHQLKDVANIINAVYSPLNIFIALIGVVVWTEQDEIDLEEDGDKTLTKFLQYRKVLSRSMPNDNAQLLTRQRFKEGVVGKGLKGPICTYEFSGAVSTNHSEVIGLVAATIAHEMGHNFGMEHDSAEDCECPDEKCIMSPSSTSVVPVHWSSCSLKSLALAFEKGMDYCLRNKPKKLFESPTCGNGFVEVGEQCDCGTKVDKSYSACSACCRADLCLLRENATCATGACCDLKTCRPISAGTVCRVARRECDLPEYCSGASEFCPADVFVADGRPCGGGAAHCARGACRSRSDQCRLLWGTTGLDSNDRCYTQNNAKGNVNGNCGYDRVRQVYRACAAADVRCGLLQCRHLNERLEFGMESVSTLSQMFINNHGTIIPCRTAIIDLGLNDVDPGLVPDGAKCGENQMCYKQRCVSVDYVQSLVSEKESSVCPSNCSGHGICNSEGHCHCEPGFGPPLCALPGPGGSVDSGPATDPSIQRNFMVTMYVVFLGIIPAILVVLFLIYYTRHNALFWKKKSKKSYVHSRGLTPHCITTFDISKLNIFKSKACNVSNVGVDNSYDNTACENEPPVYETIGDGPCQSKDSERIYQNTMNVDSTASLNDVKSSKSGKDTCEIISKSEALVHCSPHKEPITKKIQNLFDKNTHEPVKKFSRKIKKEDIRIVDGTDKELLNKMKESNDSEAKDNKPKIEIINTGLTSTTNEMIANNGMGHRPRVYSIRESGLYESGKDVKVHGFKKE